MKHLSTLLKVAIMAGVLLTACDRQASTVAPTLPGLPQATLANQTAAASPTARIKPSATPTTQAFTGIEVTFDRLSLVIPTGLAAGGSGTMVPEGKKDEVAPWDVGPEHIQLNLDGYLLDGKFLQPQIHVYPAQAYVQLQERGSAAKSLEQLRALLAQGSMVNVKELPEVPFFNVPQAMAAKVKIIPFQGGKGVRMVTEYAMGRAIINNNELIYHFEGLTDDERYYAIVILPVTAPGLPEDGTPGSAVPPQGVSVPDYNDMNANWMGYYGDVRQMLQGLEPGDYNPNLDQLDALIGSITIDISK
jgi:hypothetical protein